MNSIYSLLFMAMILCACQSGEKSNNDTSSPKLAGGWNETDITDEVKEATDFVIKRMNTSSKLKSIDEARVQIVNGKNYEITFTLENNEQWKTQVYRTLKGEMSLKEPAVLL